MDKAEAEKIANLLEELDKTSVTIREGVSPDSPMGTGPLNRSTLDDLRSIGEAGAGEKKIKIKKKIVIIVNVDLSS
ncbi:MAG: hypothetical protein H0X43_10825 [Nitrosospira sp.]|nr:hypothetical protein [Nitrosospira sp.]